MNCSTPSIFEKFLEWYVADNVIETATVKSPLELFFEDFLADIGISTSGRPLLTLDDFRVFQTFLADKVSGLVDQKKYPGYLLSVPMGMGKTAATLTGIAEILRKPGFEHWKFIVIAPLEVAKNTWPDEIEAWEHLKHLTYSVCVGDQTERMSALRRDVDILIINRENLQWLWEQIGGAVGWRWHFIVYDESSRLKGFTMRTPSHKYKDGKKIKVQRNFTEFGVMVMARGVAKYIVELTGTPAGNGVIDLGGQIRVIDRGVRLGATKTKFHKVYFDKNPFSRAITPKANAEKDIIENIKDIMIGLRAEDYMDLPPIMFNPIPIKFPGPLMKQYRQFEKDMVSLDYDVQAVSKGVLTNKLLQFANGGLYRKDPDEPEAPRETVLIHDLKLKALEHVLEEAAGESVLTAYSFKFDKLKIKKRFPKTVFFDEEPNFVKLWNAGKIQHGASHPASMSHGLNLQYGGHIQCWYGLTWSREIFDQFNKRLARGSQANTTMIHILVAMGTMDETVMKSLAINGATQDRINDAVRVRLKKARS